MADRDDALAAVDAFESSSRTGMWVGIHKADLIKGLRIRIIDPSKVNQAGSLLCGPAAFTYELATDDPISYGKAVVDLFTTGTCVIGTMLLKPKNDLIFTPFTGGIDPSDWVLMASLRDNSNWIFDVENVDDLAGAATIPSTMTGWLENIGFTKIVNETNLWYTKDAPSLLRASSYLTQQYRVMLFVNSFMIHAATQTNFSLAPDHWIMLLTPVLVSGSMPLQQTVSFYAYSWGKDRQIPEDRTKPLRLWDLLQNYYGFVAFKH